VIVVSPERGVARNTKYARSFRSNAVVKVRASDCRLVISLMGALLTHCRVSLIYPY
jgi:hypothetical protein